MLIQMIDQIAREKNIDREVIIAAIEEAMTVAARKFYRTEEDLDAKLNTSAGTVELHAVKSVVDEIEDEDYEITLEAAHEHDADVEVGDVLRIPMPTDQLGRIAAQAAKQVLYQNLRDAERENIFNEFKERVGELLTGIVKRFERGDMIVDLGRTEAILPRREQSRAEHYNIGDRIRVVIIEVLRASRGPQVVVSRTSPELMLRLFEMEVPEIFDGTVKIKGAVREGGDRAKVAVHSTEADVDPVGACVGMRGSRVQAIIRELRGEKIDIVEWAEEPIQFAINALKPARVNSVTELVDEAYEAEMAARAAAQEAEQAAAAEAALETETEGEDETTAAEPVAENGDADTAEDPIPDRVGLLENPRPFPPGRRLEVLVDDDQLSLAIGKKGQNVRLAGKLLGCKIDVKSAEQRRAELAGPIEETVETPAEEAPADEPSADEPSADEPSADEPSADEPSADEPSADEPSAAEPAADVVAAVETLGGDELPVLPLEAIPGVGPKAASALRAAGIAGVEQLADSTLEMLAEVPGVGGKTAAKILEGARVIVGKPVDEPADLDPANDDTSAEVAANQETE